MIRSDCFQYHILAFRFLIMVRSSVYYSLALLLITPGTAVLARADDDVQKNQAKTDPAKTGESKQTQAPPIKIEGVFEAVRSEEISADTEHLTSLEIKRVVPHGTKVRQGQNIVWFETEAADEKIKQAEIDLRIARVDLENAEFEYQQFQETQQLDRDAAQRARKKAQKDYDHFMQVDRERQQRTAEFNLKSARVSLANAEEELQQLKQMYEEDDLTEESEEIVLKRAKHAVESARFRLNGVQIQSERALEQTIPEQEASQEESLSRAELAYQKALKKLETERRKRDLQMKKQRDEFEKKELELDELKQERRERNVLKSPIDGIVLHGELKRGKVADQASQLGAGDSVAADKVIATIVDPSRLHVRLTVAQENLTVVQEGRVCQLTAKGAAGFEATGKVQSVSVVPYAGSKFDAVIKLGNIKNRDSVAPAMTCTVRFDLDDSASDSADSQDSSREDTEAKE